MPARLSGINIKRMSTIVWVVSGALRGDGRDAVRSPQPGRCVGARCRTRHAAARPRGRAHRRHGIDAARARGRCRDRRRRECHHLQLQRSARAARSRALRGRARDVAGQWPPAWARRSRRGTLVVRAADPTDSGRAAGEVVGSVPSRLRCRIRGARRALPARVPGPAVAARGVESCAALRARRAVAHGAHRLGRPAVARAVRVRGCRQHDDRRARARRRRLHPVAVPRGMPHGVGRDRGRRARRCAGRASISRSRRSRSRS